MNKNNLSLFTGFLLVLLFCTPTAMAASAKGDNSHARKWNQFANDVLGLHKQLTKKLPVSKTTKLGGYAGDPDYYIQETYTHKKNGKLISIVQWEKATPKNLHAIEVYVRDKQGRVLRDYSAAYLPDYRNAPTQTLVSIHKYNGDLHAFRTYEANGDRIVERCTGKLKDQEINFILDEDEIAHAEAGMTDVMEQADYKACFKGFPVEAGKYVTPQ